MEPEKQAQLDHSKSEEAGYCTLMLPCSENQVGSVNVQHGKSCCLLKTDYQEEEGLIADKKQLAGKNIYSDKHNSLIHPLNNHG